MKDEGLAQFNKLDLGKPSSLTNKTANKKQSLDIENKSKEPINQLKKGLLGWYAVCSIK